jgi:hypothetical protein
MVRTFFFLHLLFFFFFSAPSISQITIIHHFCRYLKHGNELQPLFAMTTHDYSIKDALYDYLEGKTVVSIMGGHGMSRASDIYRNVTKLAWRLARKGFLLVTGSNTIN